MKCVLFEHASLWTYLPQQLTSHVQKQETDLRVYACLWAMAVRMWPLHPAVKCTNYQSLLFFSILMYYTLTQQSCDSHTHFALPYDLAPKLFNTRTGLTLNIIHYSNSHSYSFDTPLRQQLVLHSRSVPTKVYNTAWVWSKSNYVWITDPYLPTVLLLAGLYWIQLLCLAIPLHHPAVPFLWH